jgi:hypothetical protein
MSLELSIRGFVFERHGFKYKMQERKIKIKNNTITTTKKNKK